MIRRASSVLLRPPGETASHVANVERDAWSKTLGGQLQTLCRHRELLLMVAQREITVRYKQTVLGILWALIQPLSLMLAFTLFFSTYARMPSDGIPYPLFSYTGLLPWTFFATSIGFAAPSLIVNSHIITRIYFPREIIPLASVIAALVDFGIACLLLVGLLAYFGIGLSWTFIYIVPVLAIQLVFTSGLSLLLSAVTALYRDVRFTLPLLIQLWMFATPVLYPLSVIPESVRAVYLVLNPLAVIVDAYRSALVLHQAPDATLLITTAATSAGMLLIGYLVFKGLERQFADVA